MTVPLTIVEGGMSPWGVYPPPVIKNYQLILTDHLLSYLDLVSD
jgi:hypothetical protein